MIRNSERRSLYNEVLKKKFIHEILLSQPWTHKKCLGFDRVIIITSKTFQTRIFIENYICLKVVKPNSLTNRSRNLKNHRSHCNDIKSYLQIGAH